MKSIFLILPFTSKALEVIRNEYRDTLGAKNILLFICSGFVSYLFGFVMAELIGGAAGIAFAIINFAVAIAMSVVLGLITSFILHRFGKWMGGIAEEIDIESTYAHSLIPIIIALIFVIIFRAEGLEAAAYNNSWFRNGIQYIGLFFQFKILLQGVKKFNQFSWWKAFCVLSPFFLFKIILGCWFLFIN